MRELTKNVVIGAITFCITAIIAYLIASTITVNADLARINSATLPTQEPTGALHVEQLISFLPFFLSGIVVWIRSKKIRYVVINLGVNIIFLVFIFAGIFFLAGH